MQGNKKKQMTQLMDTLMYEVETKTILLSMKW